MAHRYSESTNSYPGNLTSATVCGDRTDCALAAKRLASVAPKVDLEECTLHSPLQKANKAEPTLALNPRGDITRNPKQGYQWPQKGHVCPPKTLKKKKKVGYSSRGIGYPAGGGLEYFSQYWGKVIKLGGGVHFG